MLRIPKTQRIVSLANATRNQSTSARRTTGDEYQYLQRSKIPMLHFQPSLPRLPIPELEKTCARYLAAQQPLLAPDAFDRTKQAVQQFAQTDGPNLQALLKEFDAKNKHTSYISEPWFDMYLRDRIPLPLNYNPLLMMNPDPRPEYNEPVLRTTNLVISSLRFMKSLRAKTLEPEVFHMNPAKSDTAMFRTVTSLMPSIISTYVAYTFKAFPLDMSQYQGLFGGTRIPELGKDRIYRNESSRHLVVLRKGNMYAVDVLDAEGNIEQPATLFARFERIFNDTKPPAADPLGLLTTENRDTWAAARSHLTQLGKNAKSIELVDSALFCLCLDESTINPDNPIPAIREFLFGDGTNRWFDKSFSLIVAKDGTAGINFEHSWGDGVAVLRYFQEIFKETTTAPFAQVGLQGSDNQSKDAIVPIDFTLDDRVRGAIRAAENNHNAVIDSLDMNYMKYEGINKNVCKKQRISPDSVMQLGFQLAYYKQHGKFVATYESCSTAAFRHGRTETMRPCTVATKTFCEEVEKKRKSAAELREIMNQCSTVHGQLTKEAAMGQGFDRHLFGLKHTAQKNSLPLPALYQDPAYAAINHNILSTSTLSSPALLAGGFGPVVKDGYGIGYNIQDGYLGSVVTSYKPHRNGGEFVDCLRAAYEDISKVLTATGPASKEK
ncbi:carnitine O-palmitoyltransferase 2, mitochondrial isoform X2 [Anopheles maculipalpis]|uniref:carnitine O-palmitoyltransferase 2, mitochondrial isoform X2 n=1 Tax=Anopheles maculipalpis TaxID=1496333 RepID=UPI002158CF6F|nr:carnitine O-palmitoyltransferase 2, mitochondrial isoform X2 [Anopheles maculipalpis]